MPVAQAKSPRPRAGAGFSSLLRERPWCEGTVSCLEDRVVGRQLGEVQQFSGGAFNLISLLYRWKPHGNALHSSPALPQETSLWPSVEEAEFRTEPVLPKERESRHPR